MAEASCAGCDEVLFLIRKRNLCWSCATLVLVSLHGLQLPAVVGLVQATRVR